MHHSLAFAHVLEENDTERLQRNRARILALLGCPKPRINGVGDEPWLPLDVEAGKQIADFFEVFGFVLENAATSADLLTLWTSFQLDYSVELRLFLFDREVFNSSLKGKLRPLLDYFTAVAEGQHAQAHQLATKHRIAERLIAGEMAPLLYAAWTKDEALA
jgi:hypothetical protein